MNTAAISSSPIDSIWRQINKMNDTLKIQLINKISASLLHKDIADNKVNKKEKFLALAGSWNDDANAEAVDRAALNRETEVTRNFNFDE
ncbi:MAG: hypothetical protein ACI4T9_12115 [Prevotella sp.]|jgi:hypothetical protein